MTIRAEQADLETWRWPVGEFDVVVAIFFQFCAPPVRAQVFENIKRALKPGGLLLMEGYTPKAARIQDRRAVRRSRTSTPASCWRQSFADFASVEIEEYDRDIQEGPGHGGMSALIDLVGRK